MSKTHLNAPSFAPWPGIGYVFFPLTYTSAVYPLTSDAQDALGISQLRGSHLCCDVYVRENSRGKPCAGPLRALIDTGARFCALLKPSRLQNVLAGRNRIEKHHLRADRTVRENPFHFAFGGTYNDPCELYLMEFHVAKGPDMSREALAAPVKVPHRDIQSEIDFVIGTTAFPASFVIKVDREGNDDRGLISAVLGVEGLTTVMAP